MGLHVQMFTLTYVFMCTDVHPAVRAYLGLPESVLKVVRV